VGLPSSSTCSQVRPITSEILIPVCTMNSKKRCQSSGMAESRVASSVLVRALARSSVGVSSTRGAGIRTPRIGFELISPSSRAVAKSVESDALVFLIIDVLLPSFRIDMRSSRTSLGSISLSFRVFQRGIAKFSIVRRYSGRVVSEKPRWVRPA
jgi:hypothetical protein